MKNESSKRSGEPRWYIILGGIASVATILGFIITLIAMSSNHSNISNSQSNSGDNSTAPTSTPIPMAQQFNSPDNSFSLTYPAGWSAESTGDPNQIQISNGNSSDGTFLIGVYVEQTGYTLQREKFTENVANNICNGLGANNADLPNNFQYTFVNVSWYEEMGTCAAAGSSLKMNVLFHGSQLHAGVLIVIEYAPSGTFGIDNNKYFIPMLQSVQISSSF